MVSFFQKTVGKQSSKDYLPCFDFGNNDKHLSTIKLYIQIIFTECTGYPFWERKNTFRQWETFFLILVGKDFKNHKILSCLPGVDQL